MQVRPFSHPKPSPSESDAEETQTGLEGGTLEGIVDAAVEAATIQVELFSQPKPSPSVSLAAVVHSGCAEMVVEKSKTLLRTILRRRGFNF